LWAIIAKDLPEQHKMVNDAEKRFITQNRDIVATEKSLPPWKRFLSHFSFYAIALQYFVVQFVIALFLIWLPTYLTEQYHVNFKEMTISALPWLFMFFLILFAGAISDKILNTGQSRFVARGVIAIAGFVVFSISIFLAVHTDNLYVTIFWLSLCLGGVGISMGMSWAAATDLGRNFSGTVSGWMNLWGNVGALISPLLAGIVVDHLGWSMTLQLLIVPAIIAAILWFFVKPDKPLIVSEEHVNK
ncbi:MAG: MFS transporter, partial [Staphylococcus epidermidis]|nr:MFS transporter [Staphylococcus epidermidis]